jgi:hypothetical protein
VTLVILGTVPTVIVLVLIAFRIPVSLTRTHKQEQNIWEDIKMNLKGTECENVDGIYLAQERNPWRDFVNTAMNLRVL